MYQGFQGWTYIDCQHIIPHIYTYLYLVITACRLYQHMEFREAFLSILLDIQGLPRHNREIVDVACLS